MNDVHTRIVVCCYCGRVGTDLSVLWVATSHKSLFYLTTALHVSGIIITHLQEHKTTVTTASGNRYNVVDRVKFTDKEYR
jgi:hypothetical protein